MPDWLLSQIFVISKISAVKIKLLVKIVAHLVSGGVIDEGKLSKLLVDGKLQPHELKGVVAAIYFILVSSVRSEVQEEQLTLELQQLGLPYEHTDPLMLALRVGRDAMLRQLAEASLRLPRLETVRWQVVVDPGLARMSTLDLQLAMRNQLHAATRGSIPQMQLLPLLRFRMTPYALTLVQAELLAARELLPFKQ